jgi:hypothetical protein
MESSLTLFPWLLICSFIRAVDLLAFILEGLYESCEPSKSPKTCLKT